MSMSRLDTLLDRAWALCRKPDPLKVWEWAEKYRRLPKSVTARPGRYRVATAPFQKEPQEALTDPTISTVVMQWASRLGKTEITQNLIGYTAHYNPRNILFVKPTMADVDKWSKQSLSPMIDASQDLRRLFAAPRSRDSGNTIFSKRFPGGQIGMIGSNSTSAFRGIQAPVVICDEIDDYVSTSQGDAVALAFKRAENYPDAIQVVTSTPTYKGTSRIEEFYLKSDQRKWFVPCPHCRTGIVLMWSMVIWEKGKPETAHLLCPTCSGVITDEQRLAAVMAGEWRATVVPEHPTTRGYWLNGLNSPFPTGKGFKTKLHQFVSEFLQANAAGSEALQVWTNTFLAESYEIKAFKLNPGDLFGRREGYGPEVPDGCWLLLAAVDVQMDRLECEVIGYGENEETWGMEFKQFWGNTERDDVWRQLDDFLLKPRVHVNGAPMRIVATAVDCGYKTKRVLDFCRSRFSTRRVWPVKGTSTHGAALVSRPKVRAGRVPIFAVGTDAGKEIIISRIQLPETGPRYCHFPREYDEEWFAQLTAEEVREVKKNGFTQRLWHKTRPRNEALDIRVYSLACYEILNPSMRKIREQVEAAGAKAGPRQFTLDPSKTMPTAHPQTPAIAPVPPVKVPAPQPQRGPFVRPPGNWMGGGGRRW